MWELVSGFERGIVEGHSETVSAVGLSENGKRLTNYIADAVGVVSTAFTFQPH